MSETSGSRPGDASSDADAGRDPSPADAGHPEGSELAEQASPEQPYDVPSGAQQYGQPPSTGYQPPVTDPPGQSAPVQGPGPQQYGQPEHGQASYAQEGFPAPGPGPGGYGLSHPGQGQQPTTGAPSYGTPQQSYASQQPPYDQAYGTQPPYAQTYPGAYPGQQPYPNPPQGYPPAPPYPGQGYPQPYAQQQPLSESDQRLWATLTNISIPFFGFIGPLVAWLLLKDRSPFLKDSTTEALNFSITASIAAFVSGVLTLAIVGYVLLPVVGLLALVFAIIAAVAANKGEVYRYPLNWRLVK